MSVSFLLKIYGITIELRASTRCTQLLNAVKFIGQVLIDHNEQGILIAVKDKAFMSDALNAVPGNRLLGDTESPSQDRTKSEIQWMALQE